MAQSLPKFIVIQSNLNHKYLHLEKTSGPAADALRFEGEYSFGLETRFEVVPSATHGNGLVHIRSLQNNKFWVSPRMAGPTSWITATATKPEEDQSSQDCTLFQPVHFDSNSNNMIVGLRCVNANCYVALYMETSYNYLCLYLVSPSKFKGREQELSILDWQSIVMLPDLIKIKGDNGKHLKAYQDRYMDYNNSVSNSPDFVYEVHPSRDGGVRLKSVQHGKYWKLDDNSTWVFANWSSATDHDVSTVFIPTKLDDATITLRCMKNNSFCKRLSSGSKANCLAACISYVDGCTPMVIEEPVLSRTIDNVIYHLTDARIYDEHTLALVNEETRNRKPQQPDTAKLNLNHTETYTRQWTASVSLTLGVKTSISAGVPGVAGGSVETSYQFNSSYQWGESKEEKVEVGSEYTVTVPPMSRVKVSLMATRASCDIPFSYTQRDVLTNGTSKVYYKNDGLFKGRNAYNYRFESAQLALQ